MSKSIKDRVHAFIEYHHSNDAGTWQDVVDDADDGARILSKQGISLAAVQASITAQDFGLHPDEWHDLLDDYMYDAFEDTVYNSDRDPNEPGSSYTASEHLAQLQDNISSWFPSRGNPHRNRAIALYRLRRWLVLSNKQRGFAGILQNQQLLQAVQNWLQHVPYADAATLTAWTSCSADSLLSAVPAAVRAWLLADVAAGLLLQDVGNVPGPVPTNSDQGRSLLPDTPQHHAAFQQLLSTQARAQHHDDLEYEESVSQLQEPRQLQACEQRLQAWQLHEQRCAASVGRSRMRSTPPASSSNSSKVGGGQLQMGQQPEGTTPAAAVLAGVRSILHTSAAVADASNGICTACTWQQQQRSGDQITLPRDVAAALEHDVLTSDSSSSGWCRLHACLSSMSVALLSELYNTGSRLALRSSYLDLQQVQLQTLIIQLLAPLKQAAAAAMQAGSEEPHHHQQQQQQGNIDVAAVQLDPILLQATLSRVQGFVLAVQRAKRDQQQQLLPQLKQQLNTLHSSVQQQGSSSRNSSAKRHPCKAGQQQHSSSSSSAADASAAAAGSVPYQVLDAPDVAMFVGFGTMQLDQQQQQQYRPVDCDLSLKDLRDRTPVGSTLLDYTGTEGLVNSANAADSNALLLYWRARAATEQLLFRSHIRQQQQYMNADADRYTAAAAAAGDGGDFDMWHLRHLAHLLVAQGGLSRDQAQDFIFFSVQLGSVLRYCDLAGSTSAHKIPVVQCPAVVRVPEGNSSSSSSSGSSVADSCPLVLPGFRYECKTMSLCNAEVAVKRSFDAAGKLGLLGSYGLCNLLIRSVLSQLPGQQQQGQICEDRDLGDLGDMSPHTTSSSSAARERTTRIRCQLLERLRVLRDLAGILQPAAAAFDNKWGLNRFRGRPTDRAVHGILLKLITLAFPGCDPSGILKGLKAGEEQHQHLLTQLVRNPANTGGSANTGISLPPPPAAAAAAAANGRVDLGSNAPHPDLLAAAALSSFVSKRLLWQCFKEPMRKAGLLKLLWQHCRTWGAKPCRSRSSSSSNRNIDESVPETSTTTADSALALLQIIQRAVATGLSDALAAAAAVQQSAREFLAFSSNMSELYNTFGGHLAKIPSSELSCAKIVNAHIQEVTSYDKCQKQMHELMVQHSQIGPGWITAAGDLGQLLSALQGIVLEVLLWAQLQLERQQQQLDSQQQQQQQLDPHQQQQQHLDPQMQQQQQQLDPQQQQQDGEELQQLHSCCLHLAAAAAVGQQFQSQLSQQTKFTDILLDAVKLHLAQHGTAAGLMRQYLMRLQKTDQVRHTLAQGAQEHLATATAATDHLLAAALGLLASMRLLRLPDLQDSSIASLQETASFPAAAELKDSCRQGRSAAAASCKETPGCAVNQQQLLLLLEIGRAVQADSRSQTALVEVLKYINSSCSTGSSIDGIASLLLHNNLKIHSSSSSSLTAPALPSMQESAWQLLSAIKPSYCRLLHLTQLPEQCRTPETFEAAVLGQPLRQQQQQQQCSTRPSSSRSCRCGKPATECFTYYARRQEIRDSSAVVDIADLCAVCCDPLCVSQEVHYLSQQGPPPGFNGGQVLRYRSMDVLLQDLLVLDPQIRSIIDLNDSGSSLRCLEATSSPDFWAWQQQRRRQQQQYARALQVSLCKSGSTVGLVSRLLLLESVRTPGSHSLLHPALRTAWQQQWNMELGLTAAVPRSFDTQQQQQQQQSEIHAQKESEPLDLDGSSSSSQLERSSSSSSQLEGSSSSSQQEGSSSSSSQQERSSSSSSRQTSSNKSSSSQQTIISSSSNQQRSSSSSSQHSSSSSSNSDGRGTKCSSSSHDSSAGSSVDSEDSNIEELKQLMHHWHPDLWRAVLYPLHCRLNDESHDDEDSDVELLTEYERYCLRASCRFALTCWLLCWHCCVEERGGDYTDVKTRAAAADAASSLIGPDQLQHIRLPAWNNILTATTATSPAAAAAAGDGAAMEHSGNRPPQLTPIWWLSPHITSSSSSSQYNNQSWCAALHQAGSPAFEQHCCDHCGATLDNTSSDDQAVSGPQCWYCPCCCVAVYCSKTCAEKDRGAHREHCRVLSNLARPAGHLKGWDELTQLQCKPQLGLR